MTESNKPGKSQRPVFAPFLITVLGLGELWARGSMIRSAQMIDRFGLRWEDFALPLQWYRVLTSPYVQPEADLGISLLALLALLVLLIAAERRFGTWQTVRTFVITDVISSLAVFVGLHIAELNGNRWAAIIHRRDGGASSGTIGVVLEFLLALQQTWIRRSLIGVLGLVLLHALIFSRELADIQHVAAAFVGYAIARSSSRAQTTQAMLSVGERNTEAV